MADENVMEELPTQSNISAEEERDEDDPEPDSTTQPSSDHIDHPCCMDHGALAPSAGEHCCCMESAEWQSGPALHNIQIMDEKLRPIRAHLEYLLNKADEYQAHLLHRRDRLQIEGLCRVVPTFLKSCQPFFIYLEHTARSCLPYRPTLPTYIRSQLLHFSQQLCSRLEELILTYASFNFLTLEETNPLSISHFFIGHCQVNHIKVSIYRYCRPAPFQPLPTCRLYKLMRWNVERLPERGIEMESGGERGGREREASTEYYFLCYEEVRREGEWSEEEEEEEEEEWGSEGERGEEKRRRRRRRESGRREGQGRMMMTKMWSIGQWVQTYPNPQTEDIYEWILCGIPRAQYQQLFHLGATEPSTCSATDCLLGALLSYDNNQ